MIMLDDDFTVYCYPTGYENNYQPSRTDLSPKTITNIEEGRTQAQAGSIERITKTLNDAGVEFTPNHGTRLRPTGVEILGRPGKFQAFCDFVYRPGQSLRRRCVS